jgi:hypothetical protein
MSYAAYDFSESLNRVGIAPSDVAKVHWAWGADDGGGSYSDQYFGFVIEMKDGRIGYLTGWCDTTGWGCQDGADVAWGVSTDKPVRDSNRDYYWSEPDHEPADLNRFVRGEIGVFE